VPWEPLIIKIPTSVHVHELLYFNWNPVHNMISDRGGLAHSNCATAGSIMLPYWQGVGSCAEGKRRISPCKFIEHAFKVILVSV
jgi:hypothetical protein